MYLTGTCRDGGGVCQVQTDLRLLKIKKVLRIANNYYKKDKSISIP